MCGTNNGRKQELHTVTSSFEIAAIPFKSISCFYTHQRKAFISKADIRLMHLSQKKLKIKCTQNKVLIVIKLTTAANASPIGDESQLGGRDGGWNGRHDGTHG